MSLFLTKNKRKELLKNTPQNKIEERSQNSRLEFNAHSESNQKIQKFLT